MKNESTDKMDLLYSKRALKTPNMRKMRLFRLLAKMASMQRLYIAFAKSLVWVKK